MKFSALCKQKTSSITQTIKKQIKTKTKGPKTQKNKGPREQKTKGPKDQKTKKTNVLATMTNVPWSCLGLMVVKTLVFLVFWSFGPLFFLFFWSFGPLFVCFFGPLVFVFVSFGVFLGGGWFGSAYIRVTQQPLMWKLISKNQ